MSIPRILVVVLLSMLCHEAFAEPCVIKAKKASIGDVVIHPPGEDSFQIALRKVPVSLKPLVDQNSAVLEVLGPLHFTTPHKLTSLRFKLAKRTVLLERRLILAKGLMPVFSETRGDVKHRQGSIRLALPLGELDSETQNIPCSALTIDGPNKQASTPTLVTSKTKYIVAPKERIPLYSSPKEEAPLWVRLDGWFSVVAQKQGWVRLHATWSDGSRLQGWVPRHLVQMERYRQPAYSVQTSGIGVGGCAWSHPPKRIQVHLRPNAPIHSGPSGVSWASTSKSVTAVAFPARPDGWIRIASLPGIPLISCMPQKKLWVHTNDLEPND